MILPIPSKMTILAIAVITAFSCGGYVGVQMQASKLAVLKASYSEEKRKETERYSELLAAETERGNAIATKLSTTEQALRTKKNEVQYAISHLTTGSPCLSSAAVSVLNHQADGGNPSNQASSQPITENADFASDSDVGAWAANAIEQYETCREQLNALIDYVSGAGNE